MADRRGRATNTFDRAFLTGIDEVTEVVLVRHGEQDIPDPTRAKVGDTFDPPLSPRGREQARLVGERFSTQAVAAVYASPLQRAHDTGREIARHHRLDPVIVDDLREVELFRDVPVDRTAAEHFGEANLAGMRTRMVRERSWDIYPLSESSAEFRRRTVNAIEGIIASHGAERIVIACHAGVINAYTGYIIGAPTDMFFRPAHTSVNIVAAGDGIRALYTLNDMHHLDTPGGSFVSH